MSKKGVLIFCNPLVDLLAFVDDEFLKKHNIYGSKGMNASMTNEQAIALVKELNLEKKECGGSGSTVARWIGLMGYRVGVLGQYADDEMGMVVEKCLKECNVENKCIVKKGGVTTLICVCITPDAQRTMFGIYSASHEKFVQPIDYDMVAGYEMLMMEGYQLLSPYTKEIVHEALKRMKGTGQKAVMVISNVFQVPGYREAMLEIMDDFNIVTGTEEEYLALFGKSNLDELLTFLEQSKYELCAVTMGPKGCYIVHQGKRKHFEAPPVSKVVDTTGAGDSFTAGLLYGYLNGYSIDKAADLGNFCAGYAITITGVFFDDWIKGELRKKING